jgi:hypothetical protein
MQENQIKHIQTSELEMDKIYSFLTSNSLKRFIIIIPHDTLSFCYRDAGTQDYTHS